MNELLAQLQDVSAHSAAAFGLVALAGLLVGVAPSSLPLVSVVIGSVAGREQPAAHAAPRHALRFAAGFALGIATVDAAVGALFGFLGFVVIQVLARSLALTNLLIAVVLALIGLALLRRIRVPWINVAPRLQATPTLRGGYLLGIPFGLSTCPACTPLLLPVLGAAAATGDAALGAALMLTFGLARGAPLVLAGAATGVIKRARRLAPLIPLIERASGVLLLLAALYFLYQSAAFAGLVPPLTFENY
jgi:cytochrome c-type biogenesis protein